MKHINTVVIMAALLCTSAAYATVWYVQQGSALSTIQAGLNMCSTGDTVLVGCGTYYENIIWPNTQGIVLISEEGPGKTKINGSGNGSVIAITTGIESTTMIRGFTLTNGTGTPDPWGYHAGGGIYCRGSSPTITENTITGNMSTYNGDGGGIYCVYGAPFIIGNVISENHSACWGGGIFIGRCSATISDNTITENTSTWQGGGITIGEAYAVITGNTITNNANMQACGGGIVVGYGSVVAITNNTITENVAQSNGGGIDISFYCVGTISNNYIVENKSKSGLGGGIFIGWNSSAMISQNTITENKAECGGGIACYDNTNSTITGNTITENKDQSSVGGIFLSYNCTATIDSCIIVENKGDGIYCEDNSSIIATYNNIYENKGYGLQNQDSDITVDALNNWWGDASGPGGAGPGTGDEVSDYVNFDPWLATPIVFGDGGEIAEGSQGDDTFMPENAIMLYQNLPNPFKHTTQIRYELPIAGRVTLDIYNLAGQKVIALLDAQQMAGIHYVNWDGKDAHGRSLASGVYFYRLTVGNAKDSKQMMLLR